MTLSRKNRLRSSRDFSRVYRKGKRAATKNLAVRAFKDGAFKDGAPKDKALKSRAFRQQIRKESNQELSGHRPQLIKRKAKSVDGDSSTLLSRSKPVISAKEAAFAPRFGISISKKVHKRAVVRNRIKRQLKAIIRERYTAIAPEWQIVIVVRPPAVECSFDDFLRELEYLLQKLSVL